MLVFSVFSMTRSVNICGSSKTHLIDKLFFVYSGLEASNDKTTSFTGFDVSKVPFWLKDMPIYPTVSSKLSKLVKLVSKLVNLPVLLVKTD